LIGYVDDERQAFSREVVDDFEHPKTPASGSVSETKSRLHRWFLPCGSVIAPPRAKRALAAAAPSHR